MDNEPGPAAHMVALDPKVRGLWWLTGAIIALAAVVITAPLARLLPLPVPDWVPPAVVAAIGGFAAAIVPVVRYSRWRYALREHDLWIRRGVLWVTVSVIPFQRLQFVDTRAGPLDRLFGLAQLVVHTAALGTSGRLPGLSAAEAERLREQLAEVEPDAAPV